VAGTDRAHFHSPSVTVNPKPSRIDFCSRTSDWRLKRVDLDRTDVVEVVRILMSGRSPRTRRSFWKNSQPSGSSVAIEPTSASCTSASLS